MSKEKKLKDFQNHWSRLLKKKKKTSLFEVKSEEQNCVSGLFDSTVQWLTTRYSLIMRKWSSALFLALFVNILHNYKCS